MFLDHCKNSKKCSSATRFWSVAKYYFFCKCVQGSIIAFAFRECLLLKKNFFFVKIKRVYLAKLDPAVNCKLETVQHC